MIFRSLSLLALAAPLALAACARPAPIAPAPSLGVDLGASSSVPKAAGLAPGEGHEASRPGAAATAEAMP